MYWDYRNAHDERTIPVQSESAQLRPLSQHPIDPQPCTSNFHATQQPTPPHTATMSAPFLRLIRPSILASPLSAARRTTPTPLSTAFAALSLGRLSLGPSPTPASRAHKCTLIQVLRQGRIQQRARKLRSPQLANRPELKGVCLKVGTTKPKKPNSGERKIARVRLSTGKVVTAYIPGEGMWK